MKIMIWKLLHNHVPTRENLYKRTGVACYNCGLGIGTNAHVCQDYPFAIQVWERLKLRWTTHMSVADISVWLSHLYCSYN